ncbi:hypothetical protein BC835DRAFT_1486575 [Cytidiella melzeri]|nr:hypothetical protein BC835DRAFT_1486575 [Cytidiella melzeri]
MHLPLTLLLKTEGDLIVKCYLYRLTQGTTLGAVQYLHLFPASFTGYTPSELIQDPHSSYALLVPRPSAVYAAILRLMASYPRRNSPVCMSLKCELELLINYNLLDLQMGYVDPDDEARVVELEFDRRIDEAMRTLRSHARAGSGGTANGGWRMR